jgi:hypothetical protein
VVRQCSIKVKDREHVGFGHCLVGNHIGHKYVLAEIHILLISLPALPQSFYRVHFFIELVGKPGQMMSSTPPSTRKAAPEVAEA